MNKKNIFSMKRLLVTFLFIFAVSACTHQATIKSTTASIDHVILVWLKDGTTQAELDTIIAETKKLKQISTVKNVSVGTAIQSDRKIVDDSFDLGIRVEFASEEGMQIYLQHPQHLAFVKNIIKPKLDRIVVYDF